MADRRPLIQETPDLSESSDNTPALPSLGFSSHSPSLGYTSFSNPRPGYVRYASDSTAVSRNTPSIVPEEEDEDAEQEDITHSLHQQRGNATGLGIATASGVSPQTARRVSIQPVPRLGAGPGPKSPPT